MRKILFIAMSVLFFTIVIFFGKQFMIYRLSFIQSIILLAFMLITPLIMKFISNIVDKVKILNKDY